MASEQSELMKPKANLEKAGIRKPGVVSLEEGSIRGWDATRDRGESVAVDKTVDDRRQLRRL